MRTPFSLLATAIVSISAIGWTPLAGSIYIWKPTGSVWTPGISGVPGDVKELVPDFDKVDVAVYRIELTENYDNPLAIKVYFNRLQEGGSGSIDDKSANTAPMTFGPQSTKASTVGQTHHLTAIQVCVNNDKIKGIRSWGRTIKADGTLSKEVYDPTYELPNCKDQWSAKLSCGDGKVVTGIRAHYKYAKKGFSGLAIRCTEFMKKTS